MLTEQAEIIEDDIEAEYERSLSMYDQPMDKKKSKCLCKAIWTKKDRIKLERDTSGYNYRSMLH